MDKLKLLLYLFLILAFALCGCSAQPTTEATAGPLGGNKVATGISPVPPSPDEKEFIQTEWNVEMKFKGVEYFEDDGVNGKGIMIITETFDYNNIGFYCHVHGCSLEYFNGSEWEYIFEYRGMENMLCRVIPKDQLGYASLPERNLLRRVCDRMPNGRYRYTKLIWDDSTPPNAKSLSVEFDIHWPE